MGDDTYGGGGGRKLVGLPPERHFLHAAWLRFHHPVTKAPMEFRRSLPPELRVALAAAAGRDAPPAAADALEYFGFYENEADSRPAD
jgi:23S rRNA pseudouridine1911/1915/1917 synthase